MVGADRTNWYCSLLLETIMNQIELLFSLDIFIIHHRGYGTDNSE